MKTTGIICGSNLWRSKGISSIARTPIRTEWGEVEVARKGRVILLQRHGFGTPLPPHRINHRANIAALEAAGAAEIVSLCSTGSLTTDLAVGDIAVAADIFCLWRRDTFFESEAKCSVPSISGELSARVENTARLLGEKVHGFSEGVTYIQTIGPTFETRAEIRFLSAMNPAVAGMTAAQEVFLACEKNIPIAVLCAVDNMAHGIGKPLKMEDVLRASAAHAPYFEAFVARMME
ncbi:MAG: MTAP family purine nucleoside phosphorylase [Candidatus Brocadiia bacterium]